MCVSCASFLWQYVDMVCPCLSAEVASSSSHQVAQQPGTRRSAVETLMTLWQMLKWWTHGEKCWTLYEERMTFLSTFFATATFLLLYMFSPTVSRSAANVLSPRCEAWEGERDGHRKEETVRRHSAHVRSNSAQGWTTAFRACALLFFCNAPKVSRSIRLLPHKICSSILSRSTF